MPSIEQVLATARGEAAVLRKHKKDDIADAIEQLCVEFERAAEPFLTWIPETDAVIRSGHLVPWWRSRFAGWERMGLARYNPTNRKQRQYLIAIVPATINLDAVRADARRTAIGSGRHSGTEGT